MHGNWYYYMFWGDGEMGRWGDGEMGRWESGGIEGLK